MGKTTRIEGADEIKRLIDRYGRSIEYFHSLHEQVIDENIRTSIPRLRNDSILWTTDEDAEFERNNPEIIETVQMIVYQMYDILKG